jgi:hypothetical protein
MSTSITRNLILVAAAALTLPLMLSVPALATPKRAGITQSLAGIVKSHDLYCDGAHDSMIANEASADQYAGTPAAEGYSKAADADWQKGVDAGCGFTQ